MLFRQREPRLTEQEILAGQPRETNGGRFDRGVTGTEDDTATGSASTRDRPDGRCPFDWYNGGALIRPRTILFLCVAACATQPVRVMAQDPPPRIGPFVVDLHGTVPRFPNDPELALSRSLVAAELPGAGLGLHAGAHVYVLTWRAVTFGLGGDVTIARSHRASRPLSASAIGRPVTEQFVHVAPELSFNFGTGDGWSYLSGGIGPGTWSVVPEGADKRPLDVERLQTINYGGGARWFTKRRLAFSIDVRFYAINPSTPIPDSPLPTSPRTTLLILGAGISLK